MALIFDILDYHHVVRPVNYLITSGMSCSLSTMGHSRDICDYDQVTVI